MGIEFAGNASQLWGCSPPQDKTNDERNTYSSNIGQHGSISSICWRNPKYQN